MRHVIAAAYLLLGCLGFAGQASAQSLTMPNIVFAGAAAADWATTYHFLSNNPGWHHEGNPLLAWADDRTGETIAAGIAMDVVGAWALNRFVGRRHPKLAAFGLYAWAGLRGTMAARNYQMRPRPYCGPLLVCP